MHPADCRCTVCLVDRSSFGTDEAKAARASVSDEQVARVIARSRELDAEAKERARWTDWLASIGYGIDYGAIGGVEPPCSLSELAAAYVRITGEEDAETWEWTIAQETGVLRAER